MAFASLAASAQKPMVPPAGGKSISDQLLGIFIEDISYACDGGLNAQLVQNGSFEYNLTEQPGWGAGTAWRYVTYGHSTGNVNACSQAPLNENNPNYMRLYVERVGHFSDFRGTTGVGISNSGFGGMVLKAGEKYDFSVFLRSADGKGYGSFAHGAQAGRGTSFCHACDSREGRVQDLRPGMAEI